MSVVMGREAIRAVRGRLWSPGRPSGARREDRVRFWEAVAGGVSSEDAAGVAGVSPAVGSRWFRQAGGMRPISLGAVSGRYLSFPEREEIAIFCAQGVGVCEIGRRLGRCASTVSRELGRNVATRSRGFEYRATTAQWHSGRRACRPEVAKLAWERRALRLCGGSSWWGDRPPGWRAGARTQSALGGSSSWAAKGPTVGNVVEP